VKVRDLIEELSRMDPDDGVSVAIGKAGAGEFVPVRRLTRGTDCRLRCVIEGEERLFGARDLKGLVWQLETLIEEIQ